MISVINLAEKLRQIFPDDRFIPVYWMATEDHDFEEISSTVVYGKTLKWSVPTNSEFGSNAVGLLPTATLSDLLSELNGILDGSPHQKQIIDLINNAYLEQPNLAQATRKFIHALLGKYKLVVIDANHKQLKAGFASFMTEDANNSENFALVQNTIQKLSLRKYPAQVNPRSINLFYLNHGKRLRITKPDETTRQGVVWDTQLKSEMVEFPERFSPNVIMRPLYQQFLLPNLAYIGGPGELSYWLELRDMFEANKLTFPLLLPRNSMVWLDKRAAENWNGLGFNYEDLFKEVSVLEKEFTLINSSEQLDLSAETQVILAAMDAVTGKFSKVDPTLVNAVKAESERINQGLKGLEAKAIKATKAKLETKINQIGKVKNKVFPNGLAQERQDHLITYLAQYGFEFIENLKQTIDPLNFNVKVVEEKGE